VQQIVFLLDQLGCARKQYARNCEAERPRCFDVDKQLYSGDLLNRQISRLLTMESAFGRKSTGSAVERLLSR
jgi:hypothetical protein